jgi:uncharacterized protein YjbJ (UPF0337 family)
MNWERIEHNWKDFTDSARKQWVRLSSAQIDAVAGKREALANSIRDAYGLGSGEADSQITTWQNLQVEVQHPR